MSKSKISLVARRNGVGLDRDVLILESLLRPTRDIERRSNRLLSHSYQLLKTRWRSGQDEMESRRSHLFIERIPPVWGTSSGLVALIPNQERFPMRHLSRLRRVDYVLCKTLHAAEVFRQYSRKVEYINFTSIDRFLPSVEKDYSRFFHLAGKSTVKATEVILELWRSHPEWPPLTVVQNPRNAGTETAGNIRLIVEHLDDTELRILQNSHGIHLCPSRCEGWGHYLLEGMSCGAVVVSTDGPPMNELLSSDRGVLVPWMKSSPRHLGFSFFVDPHELEKAICKLIVMNDSSKTAFGKAAQEWYQQNDIAFRAQLPCLFDKFGL